MKRSHAIVAGVLWFAGVHSLRAQSSAETRTAESAVIRTSVTGSVSASGFDDPQYVLSFVPVQKLMLEATQHALTKEEIEKATRETPVKLEYLLQLDLLRKEGDSYRLNYLLLTREDQKTIYRVSAQRGETLANAFLARKTQFEQLASRYSAKELRSQLMFALVAGAALNWGGLDLTTELGYRIKPPRHANGAVYFVHSAEVGAQLDFRGLYLDSETAPGSRMSFSTFGDGDSLPRLQGLPDVFDGIEGATQDWKDSPEIFGALQSEYLTLVLLAIDDAGQVMNAVASGSDTNASLAKVLTIPEDRRKAVQRLLVSIGYMRESNRRYSFGVPVLAEKDKPLVDDVLKLSREIMTDWLRAHYPAMKEELSGLSPMRNGVPFELTFSEVWHYEFGFATKSLAETGFYANPRARGNRYVGYVPLVWASSVLKAPGS